jgi:hypothetical protein
VHAHRTVTEPARRKSQLRERIAQRRAWLAGAISQAIAPLRWWDFAYLAWGKIPPLAKAALPAGAGLLAALVPGRKWAGRLRRWVPVAAAALRVVRILQAERRRDERGRRESSRLHGRARNAHDFSQSAEMRAADCGRVGAFQTPP